MSHFLQISLVLVILLIFAKTAGYLSLRFHQPSVLGELIAGVVIGPSLLNFLGWSIFDPTIDEFLFSLAEIGVLFLMFVAGLELHFSELLRSGRVSALAGSLGVLVPVALGYWVGTLFGYPPLSAFFLGLTLGATSVSISAQTLMELKVLRTRVGLGLLGAAVFDDILVILLLSIFLALGTGSGGTASILWVIGRMVLFILIAIVFGVWVIPRLSHWVSRLPISQGVLTLGIVMMLFYSISAELIGGMAAITGSFLAGLFFARTPEKESLERGIISISYAFFVPIFFVNIGLTVNIRLLSLSDIWIVLMVCLIAVFGKVIGAGLGSRLAGFSWIESLQLGAGMTSRGEVGLILATVGISEGIMQSSLFSVILVMVLVTTLITPPSLRFLYSPRFQNKPLRADQLNSDEKEAA